MSRHAIRSTLAGLTLALSAGVVAAPALAATQEGPAAGHMKEQGRHHHKKMMRDGVWLPGVGPLSKTQIESLKLDAKQQGLVDQARQAQRDMHESRRDAGATGRDALKAQLDAGKLDPRALLAESDKRHEQFRNQATQVRDKWLAVWDSLNEAQRGQVTEIAKANQARMSERHARMQERMQKRHAEGGQSAAPAGAATAN